MLTFDPAEHRYFWNGDPVLNVTRALGPLTLYARIPPDVLENARQEGVAIHKMVELHCKNDLDEDSLPTWLRPRLSAFKAFLADTGFVPDGSERRVYHPSHDYAGTLDLDGRMHSIKADVVIDVKRSLYAGPAIGLQLAAYQEAENARRRREKIPKITKRYALQLNADGRYKLESYESPDDFAVFLALLTTYRWRHQHGYTPS